MTWAQVVQEIKMLRGSVTQREKEKAERATLVQQERLIRGAVSKVLPQPLRMECLHWNIMCGAFGDTWYVVNEALCCAGSADLAFDRLDDMTCHHPA